MEPSPLPIFIPLGPKYLPQDPDNIKIGIKILTVKPIGKRPLGRPRHRRKMDLEGIGINAGNWVDSTEDRDYWRALVNAALNLRVP